MTTIITPRLIAERVARIDPDVVRLGYLKAKSFNPSPLSARETLERLELEQRLRDKLDEKIRLEDMRHKGCHEL